MNTEIQITKGSHHDLQALMEVGERLFDYPIKPNRAKEFFKDPRHHIFLAYDQNKVVGMASAFHYIHPDKDPALFINEISVVEEYRNQGIARTLVKALVKWSKDQGYTETWLATEASNVAARKAYAAAGGKEDEDSIVLITF